MIFLEEYYILISKYLHMYDFELNMITFNIASLQPGEIHK